MSIWDSIWQLKQLALDSELKNYTYKARILKVGVHLSLEHNIFIPSI
jgi:hypothetical protein